ncbi:MAG: dihydrofolate reductase family protein, partial [Candidatus Anstonellaceae archaeon]
EKVVVATTSGHDSSKKKKLESLGVQVLVLGKRKVSLSRLISYLPKIGIYSLLIEGGAQIVQSAIKEKCVDKLILAVSKKRIGCSQAIPSPISPEFVKKLAKAKEEKMGEDKVYFGYFRLPWKMRYSK